MPFIRSISGLRATLGDGLKPTILSDYAEAFHQYLGDGPIVIGNDGRPSGKWIESVIAGALSSCGREVILLGTVPTPTVQFITEVSNAAGGICVTASHNPGNWNGLKFLNNKGIFLDKDENESFWSNLEKESVLSTDPTAFKINSYDTAIEEHINSILNLKLLHSNNLIGKIIEKKYKVVVDAVNASGSVAVPMLLRKLGCDVVELYCDQSGIFPHLPEPLTENLSDLAEAVKFNKADLGIAVDPDADRLVLIDHTGNPIGEEKTIVLAVQAVLSLSGNLPDERNVLINLSTTGLVDFIAKKYNAKVLRSPVGEINVVKAMIETGAVIGGEGSGGVIYPECHYGRDSLVGISLILALMAGSDSSLKDLSDNLPDKKMIKTKMTFSGNLDKLIEKIFEIHPNGERDTRDGLRIDFDDSWVQIRASNTEPIIRIISEAPNEERALELIKSIKDLTDNG